MLRYVARKVLAAMSPGLADAYCLGISVGKRHENVWTTTAAQQPKGSFSAYVQGDGFVRVSALESALEDALRAARVALTFLGRHEPCSDRCSEWQLTLGDGRPAMQSLLPRSWRQ